MGAPAPLPAPLSRPCSSAPRRLLSSSSRAPAARRPPRAVSVEAPAAAAKPAVAGGPSAPPRRRLILLRHGESTAWGRSTRASPRVPPMLLRRGAPPCAPRATSGGICGGGGSPPARCCVPFRQAACFLRPTKENIGRDLSYQRKKCRWRPAFALETGGPSNTDGQDFDEDSGFLGRTRLGRLIQAAGRELLEKLKSARTNSPTKIFLVLLGFYTANALATILGQTGDWDVLVAGVVVAAIEGIGMLMYRKPMARLPGRLQSLISMVNYWKAGVCLGLFVDAFKLGS
ncbi:ycf20-like protein isoform X2 [Panicum virgatum]|uniref:Ycf20-like protein n=1 Tax=Panicum virgatum TaxID=38727 RepID=A0A8T0XFZ5_PANVG|nr:ycf20-like protein isoform X2 [Panicum virgatum]KAG2657778.1 hypothetical protein PVAP13_1KG172900 [Panicum virgatum]